MELKLCSAYHAPGYFLIVGKDLAREGFYVDNDEIFKVNEVASQNELGSAVLRVLRAGKVDVPAPSDLGASKRLLQFGGVKSWRAFFKNHLCCGVSMKDEEVEITPYQRHEGGYVAWETTPLIRCSPLPELLGENLVALFDRMTSDEPDS